MESVAVIYLENAEGASCEVQENVSNAPALCALSEEVHVGLGDVLDSSEFRYAQEGLRREVLLEEVVLNFLQCLLH